MAKLSLELQCRALGLPEPVREFRFATSIGRKWAFDFAWPEYLIALEVEGVVYPTKRGEHRLGGRHVSVTGFKADIERHIVVG
jgi:hypothetical protein